MSNLRPTPSRPQPRAIGVVVSDPIHSRLIDSAARHIGMETEVSSPADLTDEKLLSLELVIADEPAARQLLERLKSAALQDDPYRPAVLAVIPDDFNINDEEGRKTYDGVLPMPQLPDTLAAQLSIALYSHRAFARRYEGQIEELQLTRQIFGSISSGVTVADATAPDMPLTYVNPSFEALTGYALEEVRGRNCRFLQHGITDQPGLTLVREALRDGKNTLAILRNFRKDGTPFWNELALSPIRSREGRVTHFIGIQNDVTARVEIEQALRESEKLAVTGRLAAAIAHEINNPLEAITNLTYLAGRSDDLDEVRGYLSTLDGELKRVKHVTAQALRFSRQSSRPEAIDVTDLVESVVDAQNSRIRAVGVKVVRRERFQQSLVTLESELRQVLSNLIGNATDAMRATGGTLYLRHRPATDWRTGREGVLFTIADTGEGMSAQTRSRLFQAFYSTKGTRGTGLGLWVTLDIVHRHHGRLLFRTRQSDGHSGTVFLLFLPYQSVAPAATGRESQN